MRGRALQYTQGPLGFLELVGTVQPVGTTVTVGGTSLVPEVSVSLPALYAGADDPLTAAAGAVFKVKAARPGSLKAIDALPGAAGEGNPILGWKLNFSTPPTDNNGAYMVAGLAEQSDLADGCLLLGGASGAGAGGPFCTSIRRSNTGTSIIHVLGTTAPASYELVSSYEAFGNGLPAGFGTSGMDEEGGSQDARVSYSTGAAYRFDTLFFAVLASTRTQVTAGETIVASVTPRFVVLP